MSVLSCLDQPSANADEMLFSSGLFNITGVMLLVAFAAVALASPLIRRAYRKRVVRLMGLNQVRERPTGWWDASGLKGQAVNANDSRPETQVDSQSLISQAAAWERHVTLATTVGWLAFLLVSWLLGVWAFQITPWSDRFEYAAGAGIAALIPLIANIPPSYKRKALIAPVGVILVMIIGLALTGAGMQGSVADDGPIDPGDFLAFMIVIGILVVVFHRRLRGLILPSSVVVVVLVLAFVLPLGVIEGHVGSCLDGISWGGGSERSGDSQQFLHGTFGMIGAVLAAFGLWLGFRAVGGLSLMVERGWMSDISMVSVIGLGLISIGIVLQNIGDSADSYSWAIAFLPVIWLGVPVAVYLLVLGKRELSGPARPLLLLRVFSHDKKQQKLLDELQAKWRYIGAVNLAGGPDLVDLNVDPYECAMFLSSRLHELYLPKALSPEHLASRFDGTPDREGRYRINEMFNFNTAWRENVEQLILQSKTIMLDMRGLTAEREGTSFEVGLLARHDLLGRVVAIGDEETDWVHIEAMLQKEGQSLEKLKRVDISEGLDGLISELASISAA